MVTIKKIEYYANVDHQRSVFAPLLTETTNVEFDNLVEARAYVDDLLEKFKDYGFSNPKATMITD